jgi:hypothetical protein
MITRFCRSVVLPAVLAIAALQATALAGDTDPRKAKAQEMFSIVVSGIDFRAKLTEKFKPLLTQLETKGFPKEAQEEVSALVAEKAAQVLTTYREQFVAFNAAQYSEAELIQLTEFFKFAKSPLFQKFNGGCKKFDADFQKTRDDLIKQMRADLLEDMKRIATKYGGNLD